MKKPQKAQVIDSLTTQLKSAKSLAVVDYQGLKTSDLQVLREALSQASGTFGVVKNTLLKIAFKDALGEKSENDIVNSGLEGPTALVIANDDELAPLQALAKFSKETGLPKLKFGLFSGEFVETDTLTTLSKLPAKQTLYGQLVGSLSGPTYALVGTLNANLQMLVYILNTHASSGSENSASQ